VTVLAQVAVAFCRGCLGWEDVREDGIGLYVYSHLDRPKKLFHYHDLNAVITTVRKWCDKHGAIAILGFGKGDECSASVEFWDVDAYGEIEYPDPCHALLAACVEAQRELIPTNK
jgi:hypothetical protein